MNLRTIRFVLANIVVAYHVGLTGHVSGQVSVLLFYFLSGVVIARAFKIYSKGNFARERFLVNRFLRLAPLYLLVCLLTVSALHVLEGHQKDALAFADLRQSRALYDDSGSMLSLVLNSINIHVDLNVPAIGFSTPIVPQAWSVGIELLFYFFLTPRFRKTTDFRSVGYLLVTSLLSVLILIKAFQSSQIEEIWYQNFFATAIFFAWGYWISHLKVRVGFINSRYVQFAFVLFLVLVCAAPFGPVTSDINREIWIPILGFCGVILLSLLILSGEAASSETSNLLGRLAYPIYVSHVFVIGLVNLVGYFLATEFFGMTYQVDGDYRDFVADIFGLLCVLFTFVFSLFLYWTIEKPLENYRNRVREYSR